MGEVKEEEFGPPDDISELIERALSYAVVVAGPWVGKREVYIPFLDEALMAISNQMQPIYQTVGYSDENKQVVGYRVPDLTLDGWIELFSTSGRAAPQIRNNLSKNIRNGVHMPRGAKQFVELLIEGWRDPTAPPIKKSLTHRDTLLAGIAKGVQGAYGVALGASRTRYLEDRPPVCGVTIAASALHGFGVNIEFQQADKICRKIDLPIDIASKYGVFKPRHLIEEANALRQFLPKRPVEYRADARNSYETEFAKASKRLGWPLPIFDG